MKGMNGKVNALVKIFAVGISTLILLMGSSIEAKKKWDMKVVMIGIGAKNPTFDESRFPHLTIVYTPGLISQAEFGEAGKSAISLLAGRSARDIFKGTPKVLEEWWDKKDLRHHAILFDKNGIGSWEGWIDRRDEIDESQGKGKKKKIGDMLKQIVKKGKTTKQDKKKKFNPKKDDAVLKVKMPEFDVTTTSGETKHISNFLEDGKQTLVVFFQIPSEVDLNEAKESGEGKSSGAFFKAMLKGAAGAKWEQMFVRIEAEFFEYRVKD